MRKNSGKNALVHADTAQLDASATRETVLTFTDPFDKLVGDIVTEQVCEVYIIPMPDGETEGAPSDVLTTEAGVPTRYTYSDLGVDTVKLKVINTAGATCSIAHYVHAVQS